MYRKQQQQQQRRQNNCPFLPLLAQVKIGVRQEVAVRCLVQWRHHRKQYGGRRHSGVSLVLVLDDLPSNTSTLVLCYMFMHVFKENYDHFEDRKYRIKFHNVFHKYVIYGWNFAYTIFTTEIDQIPTVNARDAAMSLVFGCYFVITKGWEILYKNKIQIRVIETKKYLYWVSKKEFYIVTYYIKWLNFFLDRRYVKYDHFWCIFSLSFTLSVSYRRDLYHIWTFK